MYYFERYKNYNRDFLKINIGALIPLLKKHFYDIL